MANPEFSFIYAVTIRQYRNESLFNDLEADETDVLILANGLREATDKAEDYAESMSQDGPYKFYDVVAVEEVDTVYTGLSYDENDYAENPEDGGYGYTVQPTEFPGGLYSSEPPIMGTPSADPSTEPEKVSVEYHTNDLTQKIPDHVGYKVFFVNSLTGGKIPAGPIFPENGNSSLNRTATGFGGLSCS